MPKDKEKTGFFGFVEHVSNAVSTARKFRGADADAVVTNLDDMSILKRVELELEEIVEEPESEAFVEAIYNTHRVKSYRDRLIAVIKVIDKELVERQNEASPKEWELLLREIKAMLISMQALRQHDIVYTEGYASKQIWEILKKHNLLNPPAPLQHALEAVLIVPQQPPEKEKYARFEVKLDIGTDQRRIGGSKKGIQIEHEKGGKQVSATFSYGRNRMLGRSTFNLWRTREQEYRAFRKQISDFVDIAIHEYKKGTKENPIKIEYRKGEQPEAALALLLEYKKRAFQEGKSFYAQEGVDLIEILPDFSLSEEEKKYFSLYANKPLQRARGTRQEETGMSAGHWLLQQGSGEKGPKSKGTMNVGEWDSLLSQELSPSVKQKRSSPL